jgi:uncharacterized damage-inducible protein DinB
MLAVHPDAMLFLIRYHIRSNQRVLEATAQLTDEEFRRDGSLDHGSAYETLLHMVVVDWSWREFCIGNDDDDSYPDGWPFPDLPTISGSWAQEHARVLAYVESLDDPLLMETLSWEGEEGPFSAPRWLVLTHVVNHGTQHRSELARYLTECGHSPGDMDLL